MTPNNVSRNSQIALTSRLFVSGWQLNHNLHFLKNCPKEGFVILRYNNNTPVGVCIFLKKTQNVQVFVRKSERQKGHGKYLLKKMRKKIKGRIKYDEGLDFSIPIFEKYVT